MIKTPEDGYLAVPWEFKETLEEVMLKKESGPIHYFTNPPDMETIRGIAVEILEVRGAYFLITSEGEQVRLDKIVTLYGKPGPAYALYESYAICKDCSPENPSV